MPAMAMAHEVDPKEVILFASYSDALATAQRSGVEWQVVAIIAEKVA